MGWKSALASFAACPRTRKDTGAEKDGVSSNVGSLRLFKLLNWVVEKQLALGLLRELGDDEVVVGVEPGHINEYQLLDNQSS